MTATLDRAPASARSSASFSLTVPRSVLREALGKLTALVPAKAQLPIVTCVKLDVADGALALYATDFETSLSLSVPVEHAGDGSAALPAKRLAEIVSNLPDGAPVSIRVKGTKATVKAGRATFELTGMDPMEFPLPTAIEGGWTLLLPAAAFVDAIGRAVRFCSDNLPARPVFNAVCLDVRAGHLLAVATNIHLLGRFCVGAVSLHDGEQRLVSRFAVPAILRLLAGVEGDITITADAHRMTIAGSTGTAECRLSDGPYPNYAQVIGATQPTHTLSTERDALIAAVKRVALLTTDARRIDLSCNGTGGTGELWVRAADADAGKAEDVVAVDVEVNAAGEPLEIGVNASYLLLILGAITSERVRLVFSGAERAFTVRGADQPDTDPTVLLVMPLRRL